MSLERDTVDSLIEEKPAAETALQELLSVDKNGPWDFDDVAVDSGLFGEIVSRGIVEKHEGGYRLTNPAVVRAVLNGNIDKEESGANVPAAKRVWTYIDGRIIGCVATVLLFAFLMRTVFVFQSVFRDGNIILLGNDPYRRRFLVESLLHSNLSAFSLADLSRLPDIIRTGEPLTLVTFWWTTALIGGTDRAVGLVLAWYPVIAGIVTTLFVYLITVEVTEDRRVGLASGLLLATTPAHVYRTSLGFGDHHAFDYVWLILTVYGLILLLRYRYESLQIERKAAFGVLFLSLGIVGQTHAWQGGPILLVPLGLSVFAVSVLDVQAGRDPLDLNASLIFSIVLAALTTWVLYAAFGWSSFIRSLVPAMIAMYAVFVFTVGHLFDRINKRHQLFPFTQIAVAIGMFATFWILSPRFRTVLVNLQAYFERTNEANIAETLSLFSGELGLFVGPLLLLGFAIFLALPYMAWGISRGWRNHNPELFAVALYAWYFFTIATVLQIRFAAQLGMFAAVFAGLGFIHLSERVDVIDAPRLFKSGLDLKQDSDGRRWRPTWPERTTALSLFVLFLLVGGIGLVQAPIKTHQLVIDDETYETGRWLADSVGHEAITNESVYVFSKWSRNRFYNFMAGGEFATYTYAQDNFVDFLASTDPDPWAQRLLRRNSYIVIDDFSQEFSTNSLYNRLYHNLGSATRSTAGVSNFQLLYTGNNKMVFRPTTTATIVGQDENNNSIHVSTEVNAVNTQFTYHRYIDTRNDGWYSIEVPYSGNYNTSGQSLSITKQDINNGAIIIPGVVDTQNSSTAVSRYGFEGERHPNFAIDDFGGHHGEIQNATRITDAAQGNKSLLLNESDGQIIVEDTPELVTENESFAVSLSLKGNLRRSSSRFPTIIEFRGENTSFGIWSRTNNGDFGARLDVGETDFRNFGFGGDNFENWTQITVVHDATQDEFRLYIGERLISVRDTSAKGEMGAFDQIFLGSSVHRETASVAIDDVRIYDRVPDINSEID